MTATDHLENISGRVRDRRPLLGRYSGPKPEPASAYRPSPFAPSTRATAAAIRAGDSRLDPEQFRTQFFGPHSRAEAIAYARRAAHPDYQETMRERAERLRQPTGLSLSNSGDDLHGALPTFTRGQI